MIHRSKSEFLTVAAMSAPGILWMTGGTHKFAHGLLVFVMLLAAGCSPTSEKPDDLSTQITLTHASAESWQVDYSFSRPIRGILLGPPVVAYRSTAWDLLTPGVSLQQEGDQEKLVVDGQGISILRLAVTPYSEFPPDNYVPVARFSDGGAAIYLGFFSGEAITDKGPRPLKPLFRLNGLDGEYVFFPAQTRSGAGGYAYFGPQEPVDAGEARLIIDPELPEWLKSTFTQVVPVVTSILRERLGHELEEKPRVLIAAGELRNHEGYSVKGGAVNNDLFMMLRGRDLLEESVDLRKMFEKLVSHELAHLWQADSLEGGFNHQEPWIHEGSAEAMAVTALTQAGLWSEADAAAFARDATRQCRESLEGTSLADAVSQGNWAPVYSCGYGMFDLKDPDVFEIWSALNSEAKHHNTTYTQTMLERILTQHAAN